jgi:hypothetical protein
MIMIWLLAEKTSNQSAKTMKKGEDLRIATGLCYTPSL